MRVATAVLVTLYTGCAYPAFQTTVRPAPLQPEDEALRPTIEYVNSTVDGCAENLDRRRERAHAAHRGQYQAGVVSAIAGLATTSGAGALGGFAAGLSDDTAVDATGVASAITGGIGLAAEVIGLLLINDAEISGSEESQRSAYSAWGQLSAARISFARAQTRYVTARRALESLPSDAPTDQITAARQRVQAAREALDTAYDALVAAATACGMDAPPPGLI